MKNLLILATAIALTACKNDQKSTEKYTEETPDITTSVYPEQITKVFDAHGGIDEWHKMQTLAFTMEKPNGDEITTTDLKNRKSLIEMPKHIIGYDGDNVWVKQKDTATYKGNAKFYYNLMFYFYAMPFVLADDGIIYEEVKPLEFEEETYPGIKISYESGVGESPEDEYILYYHPETFKMEWLGYTVTYFTKEKAKEFHFIKYSNWKEISNLVLPETLTWYEYENNVPTKKRNDLKFKNVTISPKKLEASFFEMPEGAIVAE